MFLMYVDESGDPGLVSSPTDHFILSGLVIHESRWLVFLDDLINFRRWISSKYGLRLRDEMHAAHMIGRQAGHLSRIPKHNRLAIIRHSIDWLEAYGDISIITIVVSKTGKPAHYDVFDNAWKALIQRFENTVQHKNFPGSANNTDSGMAIVDNTNGGKLRALMRKMRRHNLVPGKDGLPHRNITLTNVIEDPVMRDSQHSLILQMVDAVAYCAMQKIRPNSYMRSKRGDRYFDRLDTSLCKVASSSDPQGIVRL